MKGISCYHDDLWNSCDVYLFVTFARTKEVVPPAVSRKHSSLKDDFKGLTGQSFTISNIIWEERNGMLRTVDRG